jgi:ADP-ribose pyrophosphatase YjhB (NUDIX family)
MNGRPNVEVGVYLLNSSKTKILLGKNKLDPFWKLITGQLKYSEDFGESAQKHLLEQIDLRIDLERFKFLSSFNAIDKERKLHSIEVDYYVVLSESEEKELVSHFRRVFQGWEWFSCEDINSRTEEIFCGIVNLFKKNSVSSIEQILTITSN